MKSKNIYQLYPENQFYILVHNDQVLQIANIILYVLKNMVKVHIDQIFVSVTMGFALDNIIFDGNVNGESEKNARPGAVGHFKLFLTFSLNIFVRYNESVFLLFSQ